MGEITSRLLSVAETAKYLSLSVGYLYNLLASGSTSGLPIKPLRIGRGKKKPAIRFDKKKLDFWIDNQNKEEE